MSSERLERPVRGFTRLLNAHDALQGHLLEDIRLHIPEVMVFPRIRRPSQGPATTAWGGVLEAEEWFGGTRISL